MRFDEWASGASNIESGGVRVATYDVGPTDAPTVTYLHGYPSASHDVAPVLAELDRLGVAIRLVTLDFPGFGASEKPIDHTYSIHACADAVEATWREHGVTTTALYSHDYGVSVGQELLARRVDGSLPVELTAAGWSNGGLYPDLHRPTIGQQLLSDPEQGPPLAAQMDEELFARGIGVTWGTRAPMPPEVVHEIWASMARDDGNLRLHDLLHYMADRREHVDRWTGAIEGCDLPMAFVWGDLDPVSGAHMIERVERRIPTATITRLGDVGHWPPLEAPVEVATAVADLVRRG
jgi:pimeloyl-ACP methyl ester carboxylesterase